MEDFFILEETEEEYEDKIIILNANFDYGLEYDIIEVETYKKEDEWQFT